MKIGMHARQYRTWKKKQTDSPTVTGTCVPLCAAQYQNTESAYRKRAELNEEIDGAKKGTENSNISDAVGVGRAIYFDEIQIGEFLRTHEQKRYTHRFPCTTRASDFSFFLFPFLFELWQLCGRWWLILNFFHARNICVHVCMCESATRLLLFCS